MKPEPLSSENHFTIPAPMTPPPHSLNELVILYERAQRRLCDLGRPSALPSVRFRGRSQARKPRSMMPGMVDGGSEQVPTGPAWSQAIDDLSVAKQSFLDEANRYDTGSQDAA